MEGDVCIFCDPLLQIPLDRVLDTDPKLISNHSGDTKWQHL